MFFRYRLVRNPQFSVAPSDEGLHRGPPSITRYRDQQCRLRGMAQRKDPSPARHGDLNESHSTFASMSALVTPLVPGCFPHPWHACICLGITFPGERITPLAGLDPGRSPSGSQNPFGTTRCVTYTHIFWDATSESYTFQTYDNIPRKLD